MNESSEFPMLHAALADLAAGKAGGRFALATIVQTSGPAFRRTGASMLISEDGGILCALSGGCPQRDIALRAARVIENDHAEIAKYDDHSGLDVLVEMGCGGELEVLIEPLTSASDVAFVTALQSVRDARTQATMATCFVEDDAVMSRPRRVFLAGDALWTGVAAGEVNATLSARLEQLSRQPAAPARTALMDGGRRMLFETIQPSPCLLIVGRNTVADDLASIALYLGWEVVMVSMDAPSTPAVNGVAIMQARPEQLPSRIRIDRYTAAVVMTFAIERDIDYLRVLQGTGLLYLGAIASRERADKMRRRLDPGALAVCMPAGFSLGAETPKEIALSIAAEIVAAIRGGDGAPLHSGRNAIHDHVA